MKNKKRGFTLIELLMTIIIISVVALIAVPILIVNINSARKQNKVTQDEVLIKAAGTHVSLNRLDNNGTIDYDTACSEGNYHYDPACPDIKLCQIFLRDLVNSGALESFPYDVKDENGNSVYTEESTVMIKFVDDVMQTDFICVDCNDSDFHMTCPGQPTEPEEVPDLPEETVDPDVPETLIAGDCTPVLELQKYTISGTLKSGYRLLVKPISNNCDTNLNNVVIRQITRLKTSNGDETNSGKGPLQTFFYKNTLDKIVDTSGTTITNLGLIDVDKTYTYKDDENKTQTVKLVQCSNKFGFCIDENGNKVYELNETAVKSLNWDGLWSYNTNIYFEYIDFDGSGNINGNAEIGTRRYRHPFSKWICCDCPDDPAGVSDSACKVGIYRLKSIIINEGNQTLKVGETVQLTITYSPTTAANQVSTFTSSKESIVTVDTNGKITAVGVGSTYITAKSNGRSARIKVTVTE